MQTDIDKIQQLFALAKEITDRGIANVNLIYRGHVQLIEVDVTPADTDYATLGYPHLLYLERYLDRDYRSDPSLDEMITALEFMLSGGQPQEAA